MNSLSVAFWAVNKLSWLYLKDGVSRKTMITMPHVALKTETSIFSSLCLFHFTSGQMLWPRSATRDTRWSYSTYEYFTGCSSGRLEIFYFGHCIQGPPVLKMNKSCENLSFRVWLFGKLWCEACRIMNDRALPDCPNCSSICRLYRALGKLFYVISLNLCLSLPVDEGNAPRVLWRLLTVCFWVLLLDIVIILKQGRNISTPLNLVELHSSWAQPPGVGCILLKKKKEKKITPKW